MPAVVTTSSPTSTLPQERLLRLGALLLRTDQHEVEQRRRSGSRGRNVMSGLASCWSWARNSSMARPSVGSESTESTAVGGWGLEGKRAGRGRRPGARRRARWRPGRAACAAGTPAAAGRARRRPRPCRAPRPPTAASVESPTGPPPNFVDDRRRIAWSSRSRPSSSTSNTARPARAIVAGDRALVPDLGEVAHAAQQPVRDPRGPAGAPRDLAGAVLVGRDAEDPGRAADDLA